MIYSRGNKHDYNRWAALGMDGWSWKDVLPFFKKSESITISSLQTSDKHGTDGPVNIEYAPYRSELASAFVKASKAMGQEEIDYNSGKQIGTSYPQLFTKNGHRHSAFKAFIKPILHRENLDIMIRTEAIKILLDNELKATGILVRRKSKEFPIHAKKEVILTAGALNSPKLLMASGIGPDHVLKRAGIEQVHSLPVGRNLLDQVVYYGPVFKLDSTGSSFNMDSVSFKSLHEFKHGKGPLTVPGGIEALSFVRLRRQYLGHQAEVDETPYENLQQSDEVVIEENNGWKNKSLIEEKLDYFVLADKYWKHNRRNVPDIEVVLNSMGFHGDHGYGIRKGIGMTDEIYNEVYKPLEDCEHDTFLAKIILLRPKSRGYLTMGGNHHENNEDRQESDHDDDDDDEHDDEHHNRDPLKIHANYLENRKDIDLILRGIKYIIKLSETPAFKKLGARLYRKELPPCEKYVFGTDDYWKCSIEVLTTSALHHMGTCKMGHENDENSVVTPNLKVRGVKNLRVADNSVIPIPVGAHAAATAYMIGEKAADIISSMWSVDRPTTSRTGRWQPVTEPIETLKLREYNETRIQENENTINQKN